MTQIFLSYKREDRQRAKTIATALLALGYDVWWDVELLPGEDFYEDIARVIKNAKATLVLWSELSVSSRPVRAEADLADRMNILIPVQIDDVIPPLPFNSRHTIDLTNWDGDESNPEYKSLLQALIIKVGEPKSVEKPQDVIEQDLLRAEDTWKTLWNTIINLRPESKSEYQSFVDRYTGTADEEVIRFAYRRIAALTDGHVKNRARFLWSAVAGTIFLCAAILQIYSVIIDDTSLPKSSVVQQKQLNNPDRPKGDTVSNIDKPTLNEQTDVSQSIQNSNTGEEVTNQERPQQVTRRNDIKVQPEDIAFNDAKSLNTVSAYGNFARKFPESAHLDKVIKLAWERALNLDTQVGYRVYISNFQNTEFNSEAETFYYQKLSEQWQSEVDVAVKNFKQQWHDKYSSAQAFQKPSTQRCDEQYRQRVIYYEYGKAASAETANTLLSLFDYPSSCKFAQIRIVGHDESANSDKYSELLSKYRSEAVSNGLKLVGVPPNYIVTEYKGEKELFVETGDGVKEALNRRVEILLTLAPN